MSKNYPYQAKALMRFKAQDGQFVLGTNQIVTVTGQNDDEGDWLNVTDQEGGSGSVPAGFLIEIQPEDLQPEPQPTNLISTPPTSISTILQDPPTERHQPSDHPILPAKPSSETHPTDIPAPIENSPSLDPISLQPVSTPISLPVDKTGPTKTGPTNDPIKSISQSHSTTIPVPIEDSISNDPITHKPVSDDPSENMPTPPTTSKPNPIASITPHDPPSSQPSSTPSQAPPPPAPKPNALRDRIAMFNKPAPHISSPPPNTRPKPPVARKPMNIPPPAPPIDATQDSPSSTPGHAHDECARSNEPTGMSAADAEESVKAGGSLKDRIRLLQQQQQQQALASEQSSTPPKPKREWSRPVAAPADEPNIIAPILPSAPQEIPNAGENITDPENEGLADSTEVNPVEAAEEEDEVARRRRIAERMAKLGGARMGFGFPGPAAIPPKPSSPQPSSEELNQVSEEPAAEEFSALPPERIVMPAIPKRAAPPRRKAPALPKSPSTVETPLQDQPDPSDTSADQSKPDLEDSLPQTQSNVELSSVDDSPALGSVDDTPALATEPSDNAPQSSDENQHEPPSIENLTTLE